MSPLKNILKVGTILGDGVRAYTVERITTEAIYLRGHPDGQHGEKENRKGALRIIPTVVIEDILRGLESKVIQLDDIMRKRGDERTEDLFSLLGVDHDKFILGYDSTIYKICELCLNNSTNTCLLNLVGNSSTALPKPFLLLAGISGTGKTRFVREQAAASHRGGVASNYCLIPVRPDWHEPSDLLGYISRIGSNGARYVVTDLLRFVVRAWQDAKVSASASELACKAHAEMTPYWLCLDEMNLAPVEQYFADYLSVLESRKWEDGNYSCDPLLKTATIRQLDEAGLAELRKQLELGAEHDDLWQYFIQNGIPLPPNLIVAGTVNMDETTHGFSRKVIDRAFTIDFGVFYPNDFADYFEPTTKHKTLGFPVLSAATQDDLASIPADAGGAKSIAFLAAINTVLKTTPFELAYRALNELLLAVVCFQPKDDAELQAVWDDFLMTKVLPRIDGDAEKLGAEGESSLLTRLLDEVNKQGSFEKRVD